MYLELEHLDRVVKAARLVRDADRDSFFKDVADLLRGHREITDANVEFALRTAAQRRGRAA